jgi:hypothetical protein
MATVKELVTRFGFEIDDAGLKQIEEGISAARDGLLGLGVVIGGAALTLYGFLKTTADAGDALKVQSDQLGIAVEALQRYQFAAHLSNVSNEEMTQGLTLLSRNIANAAGGSTELLKAFRDVGISGAELRAGTVKTDQAFEMIQKRMAAMPDGPKKVALAMELFGRSGARMIGVFKTLEEGLDPLSQKVLELSTITRDQAEQGDAFNDSLDTMHTAVTAMARIIGFELMPAAKDVVIQITKWIVQNRELIKSNLTGFVKGLVFGLKAAIRFANILVESLAGLAHGMGGVETATKLLLITLTILSGASILIGIGKLVEGVVKLGNSFTMAGLKAAAIPLLIGAAVVALLLIMEDIYSFFQGKDSFTGDLLKAIPEIGDVFKTAFEPIFEPFVSLITQITEGFGSWESIFKTLGTLVVNTLLLPLRAIVATVGGIASIIGRLSGSDTVKNFAVGAGDLAKNLTAEGIGNFAASLAGPTQAVAGAGAAGANNQVAVTNQFNFPPGTDPTKVQGPISSAVSGGLDDVLRNTNQNSSNGGAY